MSSSGDGQIVDYFADKVLFVTGATGFLGQVILEKLLSTCRVRKVYILVRQKKGKTESNRYKELFDCPIFGPMKEQRNDYMDVVQMVQGDCTLEDMGISDQDWKMLEDQVQIVFHCAATVRFDQVLRIAYNINIRATKDLLKHSRNMKNLESFVHVSTAYSNCPRTNIDETIVDPPMSYKQLEALLETFPDDEIINRLTPAIIGEWPNTYAFTKCLCEQMIRECSRGLPICLVRPSMVSSTYNGPIVGWINNFYGPVGVFHGVGLGLIRTLYCIPEYRGDIVPVDYVVNALFACTWATSKKDVSEEIKVYNYVAGEYAITWEFLMNSALKTRWPLASVHMVWKVSFRYNRYKWKFYLDVFRLHTVYAYCGDLLCKIVGKKPMFVEGYAKVHKFLDVISYFTNREWKFANKNVKDLWYQLDETSKQKFEFRINTVDYDKYIFNIVKGGRLYLTNDPLDTLPKARRKMIAFTIAHYIILATIYYCIWLVVKYFWQIIFRGYL